MVLSIPATIGSIFDNICTSTDTADVCHRFLNHDPILPHHLPPNHYQRTIEVAKETGTFGAGPRLTALDSSPLWGAARVEDTYNLLGHALRKALGVIARKPRRGLADLVTEANASLVGGSSLKAALDRDWDDPEAREQALIVVLKTLSA